MLETMFGLKDKVALVTGGGRGIGKTIAEAYLEAGAQVVITGRRAEFLEAAIVAFAERGFVASSLVADVSEPVGVTLSVQATLERHGQIDILVNNAGQTWGQPTEDLALE